MFCHRLFIYYSWFGPDKCSQMLCDDSKAWSSVGHKPRLLLMLDLGLDKLPSGLSVGLVPSLPHKQKIRTLPWLHHLLSVYATGTAAAPGGTISSLGPLCMFNVYVILICIHMRGFVSHCLCVAPRQVSVVYPSLDAGLGFIGPLAQTG